MAEIHNIKKHILIILKQEHQVKWLEHNPIKEFAFPYYINLIAKNFNQNSLF